MRNAATETVAQAMDRWPFNIDLASLAAKQPKWWSFKVMGFDVRCYNFQWRQRAIAHHDLHHMVTGYPCTMAGEIQVAAWEFAAGRFPNIYANLFCLPLVTLGVFTMPQKLWAAFKFGRRSQSLFATPITANLLNLSLEDLRAKATRATVDKSGALDAVAFCVLVSLALLLVALPATIGLLLFSSYQ